MLRIHDARWPWGQDCCWADEQLGTPEVPVETESRSGRWSGKECVVTLWYANLGGGDWNMTFICSRNIRKNHPKWLSYFSEGWLNHQPVTVRYWWLPSIVDLPIKRWWFSGSLCSFARGYLSFSHNCAVPKKVRLCHSALKKWSHRGPRPQQPVMFGDYWY